MATLGEGFGTIKKKMSILLQRFVIYEYVTVVYILTWKVAIL